MARGFKGAGRRGWGECVRGGSGAVVGVVVVRGAVEEGDDPDRWAPPVCESGDARGLGWLLRAR